MKRKRIISLTLAGAVAAVILMAGTYAWRSISQEATNEARTRMNPGARLHDDFTGMSIASDDGRFKNVYVENFTDQAHGDKIYARIRLDEYLEIGVGAGKSDDDLTKSVTVIKQNAADPDPDMNEKDTWITYRWNDAKTKSVFRDYVAFNTGTDAVFGKQDPVFYMPTFNKNKDSLEADINGTLAGSDGDKETDADAYEDYILYGDGSGIGETSTKSSIEIYDADGEAADEFAKNEIVDYAHLTVQEVIDSVLDPISGGFGSAVDLDAKKVTLMAKGATTGKDYLITQVVPAEAATLTEVQEIYVDLVNAIGTDPQDAKANIRLVKATHTITADTKTFATEKIISMAEWKKLDEEAQMGNFWVYDTTDGWVYWASPIEPGTATGRLISGITTIGTDPGKSLANQEYYYALNVVAQFATAGDWGDDNGEKETSTGFYGEGISSDGLELLNTVAGMSAMNDIQKAKAELRGAAEDDEITIDGTDYIVVKQDAQNGKALLVAKDILKDEDGNVIKKTYDAADKYLNSAFMDKGRTLGALAIEQGGRNKLFMLSEGDVVVRSDLTVSGVVIAAPVTAEEGYWLRTTDSLLASSARIITGTTVSSVEKTTEQAIRPAVWVNYKTAVVSVTP